MALNMNDYESVSLKGSKVNFLKRHKKDFQKFIFDFTKNKKRYRQLYIAPRDTPVAMISTAKLKCEAFYEQAGKIRDDINNNITVDAYWNRFCEYKKGDWGGAHDRTLKGYYTNHIKSIIGHKQLRRVNTADIDDIMHKAKSLSKRSQKAILEVLKPLFSRAITEGLIGKTPIYHEVKRNAAEEKKIIIGADVKFKKIHKAINDVFSNDPKLRAAFLFGFNGRRLSEVLTLQWQDLDFDNSGYVIRAENSKVNNDMAFGLNNELKNALIELQKQRDSLWVFSSNRDPSKHMTKLSMHYDKIRRATGIKEFTYHWMRNLLVSALVGKNGVDVSDLSALLGHNDTGTLKKYLSLQREQSSKKAGKAMEKILK
jgi:integrase